MTVFDLVFILVFLSTVVTLAFVLYAVVRGQQEKAGRVLRRLGTLLAAYLGTVVAVSLLTPRRVLGLKEDQCFDDWCVAVEEVRLSPAVGPPPLLPAKGIFYVVELRVSSRALRRAQSAPDTTVYLLDNQGRTYHPSPEGQRAYEADHGEAASLGARLQPGGSFHTVRVFDLPGDARDVGLVVSHGEGPGWFIIGDSQSLLHKRTMIRLRAPGVE